MSDYDDSFNMMFGTNNKEIDWFDNPYISANVYDLNQEWIPKLSTEIKLQTCTMEQLL